MQALQQVSSIRKALQQVTVEPRIWFNEKGPFAAPDLATLDEIPLSDPTHDYYRNSVFGATPLSEVCIRRAGRRCEYRQIQHEHEHMFRPMVV